MGKINYKIQRFFRFIKIFHNFFKLFIFFSKTFFQTPYSKSFLLLLFLICYVNFLNKFNVDFSVPIDNILKNLYYI